jgi:hypothetical protein
MHSHGRTDRATARAPKQIEKATTWPPPDSLFEFYFYFFFFPCFKIGFPSNFLFEFQVVRTSNRSKFEGPLYFLSYDFCIFENLNLFTCGFWYMRKILHPSPLIFVSVEKIVYVPFNTYLFPCEKYAYSAYRCGNFSDSCVREEADIMGCRQKVSSVNLLSDHSAGTI